MDIILRLVDEEPLPLLRERHDDPGQRPEGPQGVERYEGVKPTVATLPGPPGLLAPVVTGMSLGPGGLGGPVYVVPIWERGLGFVSFYPSPVSGRSPFRGRGGGAGWEVFGRDGVRPASRVGERSFGDNGQGKGVTSQPDPGSVPSLQNPRPRKKSGSLGHHHVAKKPQICRSI